MLTTLQFGLATFQVLISHMWLVATILDSAGLGQFIIYRKYRGQMNILGHYGYILIISQTEALRHRTWFLQINFKGKKQLEVEPIDFKRDLEIPRVAKYGFLI